jgi:serine/threonine protein kinase
MDGFRIYEYIEPMNSTGNAATYAEGLAETLLPRRVGRYDLLEEIGSGATSRVYRAREVETGAIVAVKVIHLESIAPDFQRRLRNEREIQQGVGHENIVRLIDWFESGDSFYLVMECVDGQSLYQRIHGGGGPIPFPEARRYLLGVLSGIGHLHELGIVHRDVKPANILL